MKRTPLRRKIRIKLRNPKRLARLRAEQFGPQAALCRTLPCCVCGAMPPSDPMHVKARGMGGCNSDDSQTLPGCRRCHRQQHSEGVVTFFARRGLNPEALLARVRGLVADASDGEGLAVSPWLGWLE